MRTTEININGNKKSAVLVAGGPGFKIYTVAELDGWVLTKGRKISFVEDNTTAAQVIADYVNLRYHSPNLQETIKINFSKLLNNIGNETSSTEASPI